MKRFLAWMAALVAPALVLASSCTTNGLVAKGGTCFQTIDCQDGLICKYANDAGSCTDDLSGLNTLPAEAAADTPAQQDVTPTDSPADTTPPPDTGPPDTGPPDTGPPDTGLPDTGTDTGASDAGTG